jgi:hypothetical protein
MAYGWGTENVPVILTVGTGNANLQSHSGIGMGRDAIRPLISKFLSMS